MSPFRSPLALVAAFAVVGVSLAIAGMAPSRPPLSDEELLHVFITGNRAEIVTSEPLLDDLENPEANQFARVMIAAHTRVIEQAMALDLDPEDNPVSMTMTEMVTRKADMLDGLDSPELDMKYIETQVVLHGHTLDMIDHVLLPNVDDDAFRALLQQVRPDVMMHFERAKMLHHQMMAMAMGDDGMMPGHSMDGDPMQNRDANDRNSGDRRSGE